MTAKIREKYLLYRVQSKKDAQAYAQLYDLYITPIYRFVFFKVSTHEDAEDITADVFLKAWHYMTEHTDIRSFRAVIYRIARNLVIDHYRKHASRPEILESARLRETEEGDELVQEPSDKGALAKALETQQDYALVLSGMNKLKEEYREVLLFRYVDGLSPGEVSDILGTSKMHVRVLTHRALKALRKILNIE